MSQVDFREYHAAFMAQNDALYHHGILGMKWGVRRYQNPDGSLTPAGKIRYRVLDRYNTYEPTADRSHSDYNLDKWGTSKETNVLWVTGISGSGKSTIANAMAKNHNADVINIDLYTFKTADKYLKDMSKGFNSYLDKNVPNWKQMQKEAYEVLTKTDRRKGDNKKAAGLWFDTFEEAVKGYGAQMYGQKKVIAEGVQILDETLFYNNKQALKTQPVIVMNTSFDDALLSRMKRDGANLDKLLSPDRVAQYKAFQDGYNYVKSILDEDDIKHSDYLVHHGTSTLLKERIRYKSNQQTKQIPRRRNGKWQ